VRLATITLRRRCTSPIDHMRDSAASLGNAEEVGSRLACVRSGPSRTDNWAATLFGRSQSGGAPAPDWTSLVSACAYATTSRLQLIPETTAPVRLVTANPLIP